MREGSDRGEMEDEALRESEAERGRETGEKSRPDREIRRSELQLPTDKQKEENS